MGMFLRGGTHPLPRTVLTTRKSPASAFFLIFPSEESFPMKRHCALMLVFALTFGPLAGTAQKPAPAPAEKPAFDMTIDSIMRGAGLFGYPPAAVRWSPDSKFVYFQWKKYDEPREKNMDTYVITADGGGLKRLSEE